MAGAESDTLDLHCPQGAEISLIPLNIYRRPLNKIGQSLKVNYHPYV